MTFSVEYHVKILGYQGLNFIRFYQVFMLSWKRVCIRVFPVIVHHHRDHHILTLYAISEVTFQGEDMLPKICYVDISVQVKHRGQ